nr:hypothetical protein [Alphaproteobacteria bacterium]
DKGNKTVNAGVEKDGFKADITADDKGNKTVSAGVEKDGFKANISADDKGNKTVNAGVEKDGTSGVLIIDTSGQVLAELENSEHNVVVGVKGQLGSGKVNVYAGEPGEKPDFEHTFDFNKKESTDEKAPLTSDKTQSIPAPEVTSTDLTALQKLAGFSDAVLEATSNSTQATASGETRHNSYKPLHEVVDHLQNTLQPGQTGSSQPFVPFANTTPGQGDTNEAGCVPQGTDNSQTRQSNIPNQLPIAIGLDAWVPTTMPVVEALVKPIVVEGVEFKYRISGTNIYVQDPHVPLEKLQQYFDLAKSQSWYGQRAFAGLSNEETAVFLFADELIPNHQAKGFCVKDPSLEGTKLTGASGSQKLGAQHIALGTEETPGANGKNVPGHEGGHRWVATQTGGDAVPGYVAGNSSLTNENLAKLFTAYADDAKALGYQNLTTIPRELADAAKFEYKSMFYDPFQIFVKNFKGYLEANGIKLSPYEMDLILKQAQLDIFNGRVPSQQNHYAAGINGALDQAEQHLAAEVYALYTEVDIKKPGFVASKSPTTHQVFEEFVGGNVPSGQGPLKPHWYQRPLARGIFKAMPFVALGTKIGSNYLIEGSDLPTAIGDGITDFAIDSAVFTPVFSVLSATAGGPITLCIAGVGAVAEFVPNVPYENWVDAANRLENAILDKDPSAYYKAKCDMQKMANQEVFKDIFTLGPIRDWLKDRLDDHFPNFRPEFKTFFYALGQGMEQVGIAQVNQTRALIDLPPLPMKTGDEIEQNVDAYRQQQLNKTKPSSSDKGKEDAE